MSVETIERALENWKPDSKIEQIDDVSGIAHSTSVVSLEGEETDVVLKFCHDQRFRKRFRVEPAVTGFVKRKTDLPVPEILFTDFSEDQVPYPYYISEKLGGYNPRDKFRYLPKQQKKELLFEAGKTLAELHRDTKLGYIGLIKTDKGVHIQRERSWPDTLDTIISDQLEEIAKTPYRHLIPEIRRTVNTNMSMIDIDMEPRMIHKDFRPANMLIKDGKITAVLDWEGSVFGHKEYDLFKAEREFIDLYFENEELRKEYRRYFFNGYRQVENLKDGWQQRRKFYRFTYLIEALAAYPDWDEIYSPAERKRKEQELINEIQKQSLMNSELTRNNAQIDAET